MVLTRATMLPGPDGVIGTADDIHENVNTTTPFVDQNQTYTSHPSHQVFLRAYHVNADGLRSPPASYHQSRPGWRRQVRARSTIDEIRGMSTWKVVKAQARDYPRHQPDRQGLRQRPLLATDQYGNFIKGAQRPAAGGDEGRRDGLAGTATTTVLVEGNPAAPIDLTHAVRTGHQFLIDVAHNAVPASTHRRNSHSRRR